MSEAVEKALRQGAGQQIPTWAFTQLTCAHCGKPFKQQFPHHEYFVLGGLVEIECDADRTKARYLHGYVNEAGDGGRGCFAEWLKGGCK